MKKCNLIFIFWGKKLTERLDWLWIIYGEVLKLILGCPKLLQKNKKKDLDVLFLCLEKKVYSEYYREVMDDYGEELVNMFNKKKKN